MHLLSRYGIHLVVAATFLLAVTYSVVTPLFEASDELWHYPFVKRLADGQGLAEYDDPHNPAPWRQEAYQPPLYYFVSAALTFWIDTSDLPAVRVLNPHADIGVPQPDGNINMVVHDPVAEAFPWHGTALAMHLVRLFSAVLCAGTVYCTYRFVLEVFPEAQALALGSAALVGFTPMFVFIGGVVNNDNAVIFLSTLTLWQLARLARSAQAGAPPPGWRTWLALGVTLGLGLLSKNSALGLGVLAAVVVLTWLWRVRAERTQVFALVQGATLAAGLSFALSGWWYWRNWLLYGDPTGLAYFLQYVGRRVPEPTVLELWNERWGFMAAYWGFFGGVNVLMAHWIYDLLNVLAVLAAASALVWLGAWLVRRTPGWTAYRPEPLPLVLALTWPLVIVGGVERWAATTMASQGRLTFPAIACFALLMALGLSAWLPRRAGRFALAGAALGLFTLAAVAPFVWIAPAYAQPPQLDTAALPADVTRLDADFNGQLRLLGYRVATESVRPGEAAVLTLYWETLARPDRNWSVFVHVLDENDVIIAQRDTYPGLGALAAASLTPGRAWADTYHIALRETSYAPSQARFAVGVYDLRTGERARTPDGRDALAFGALAITAPAGAFPNPLAVNFEGRILLAGYALDRRVARPGETMHLTLYWRAQATMGENYSVFAHVLGEKDSVWARDDAWPQDGAAPTSTWKPGQVITDSYDLTVALDTPPGVYDLEVGLYVGETRLRVLAPDGRVLDNRVFLSKVRVNAP